MAAYFSRPTICFTVTLFLIHSTSHTQIYTLSLHDALPILINGSDINDTMVDAQFSTNVLSKLNLFAVTLTIVKGKRSEEHTSELQSRPHLVCRLLLEKKNRMMDLHIPHLPRSVIPASCRLR